jgi:hypothetical protein
VVLQELAQLPSGSAPGKPSTICPSLTSITVGIDLIWK